MDDDIFSFKNKEVKTKYGEVYASRIIASWYRSGGKNNYSKFRRWCIEELAMSENDAKYVCYLFENGKMEMESSVKMFLKNNDTEEDEGD